MAGSGTDHLRPAGDAVLRVENLVVEFPVSKNAVVHAVSDVSLDLKRGETLGVVGESGCGKSTTGKAVMRVPPPTSGRVLLGDVDLATVNSEELRQVRSRLQMIFQDPISSLNPRRTIRDIVAEPLTVQWLDSFPRSPFSRWWSDVARLITKIGRHSVVRDMVRVAIVSFVIGFVLFVTSTALAEPDATGQRDGGTVATIGSWFLRIAGLVVSPLVLIFVVLGIVWLVLLVLMPITSLIRWLQIRRARSGFIDEVDAKVAAALEEVGIPAEVSMPKRPHEFSGGQAQRISIARALILEPEIIICDEPVSALDVSVQAQVLNLLEDLKAKYHISLVFIAHDLAVVKNISDRVQVMYLGKTCEVGPPDLLYSEPRHPYTRALMSAIPVPDPLIDPRAAEALEGELPSPISPPSGCRFRTRCPHADSVCETTEPTLDVVGHDHFVACHHPLPVTPVAVAASAATV